MKWRSFWDHFWNLCTFSLFVHSRVHFVHCVRVYASVHCQHCPNPLVHPTLGRGRKRNGDYRVTGTTCRKILIIPPFTTFPRVGWSRGLGQCWQCTDAYARTQWTFFTFNLTPLDLLGKHGNIYSSSTGLQYANLVLGSRGDPNFDLWPTPWMTSQVKMSEEKVAPRTLCHKNGPLVVGVKRECTLQKGDPQYLKQQGD